MLLLDTGKLEKALGEEAAHVILQAFEKFSEEQKQEAATKGDLRETELRLLKEIEVIRAEIQRAKSDTLKWTVGLLVAQTATIIAAIMTLIK